MTVLLVDNYDSFTYNLVHLLQELGADVVVRRNDAVDADEADAMAPSHLVISPGPGRPQQSGATLDIVRRLGPTTPTLGVCLGHQAVVEAFGGEIGQAARLLHGKTSLVHHEGEGLLAGLPRPFEAMRYHSLVADPASIPPSLIVTAWCKDGTVMGVRHRRHSVHGVQFHPESIGTPSGRAILEAFLRLAPRPRTEPASFGELA